MNGPEEGSGSRFEDLPSNGKFFFLLVLIPWSPSSSYNKSLIVPDTKESGK